MRVGRPVPRFVLSPSERLTLEQYARRPTTAQGLALRARIVLRCATGATHTDIAADLGVTIQTVGKWRTRFGRGWRDCSMSRGPGRHGRHERSHGRSRAWSHRPRRRDRRVQRDRRSCGSSWSTAVCRSD